jgi:predicted DNA-binding transcriptional regulator YafY
MARNEQLIRQHRLLQILERRRFGSTLDELTESIVDELGLTSLHPRSIRRDLEALLAAGFDIAAEESPRGKLWRMRREDRGLHRIHASASELIALSMGRDLLLPLVGTPFWHGIESFWNKVREQLPDGVWEHYQRYRRHLHILGVPAKTYEKQQGILRNINRAIQEHRQVEIEYQSVGKPTSRRIIEPYALVIYQSSIYVVATEADREPPPEQNPPEPISDRIRHWKLDRFEKAHALDTWFKPDPQVDLDQHLGQSIGIFSGGKLETYRVRLSNAAAGWVKEDPWHPNQTLDLHEDGDWVLTVPAFHPLEILAKVLPLGTEAEVLSPESCRQELATIAQQLASRYRQPVEPQQDSTGSGRRQNDKA